MVTFKSFLEMWDDDEESCEDWTDGGNWGRCGASGCIVIAEDTKRILVDQRGANVDGGAAYGTYGGAIASPNQSEEENVREELAEETGYTGQIKFIRAYRYEDHNDEILNGGPWFYQNFIAIVPKEFSTQASAKAAWETRGGKWVTLQELKALRPQHPGLRALIQHSGAIIQQYAS